MLAAIGYWCDRPDNGGFGFFVCSLLCLFVYCRNVDFELEKWLNTVYKQGLMHHPSSWLEDSNSESNMDYGNLAQEVSKGKILVN